MITKAYHHIIIVLVKANQNMMILFKQQEMLYKIKINKNKHFNIMDINNLLNKEHNHYMFIVMLKIVKTAKNY